VASASGLPESAGRYVAPSCETSPCCVTRRELVTIAPNGEVKIDVKGVTGDKCQAMTADLEQMLGGEVLERHMKAEVYQEETQSEQA
jgi:hypothetical protein